MCMAVITPTITTSDAHEYREQLQIIAGYASGVHIDFADGVFAPNRLLPLSQAWRPDDLIVHAHIMYKNPLSQMKHIIGLGADLVILHAESQKLDECLEQLAEAGVRAGIALLPDTHVSELSQYEGMFEHVLVFGGNLGFQGGEADLSQVDKVHEIKQLYPDVEISWDGGVNDANVKTLASAGVDVLNVGGFLKKADDPQMTYTILQEIASAF